MTMIKLSHPILTDTSAAPLDVVITSEYQTSSEKIDVVVQQLLGNGEHVAITYIQIETVLRNLGYDPFDVGDLYLQVIDNLEKHNVLVVERLPDSSTTDPILTAIDEADETVEILTRALLPGNEYRHSLLSADRERRLLEVYQDGKRARQELEDGLRSQQQRSAERRIVAGEQALDELIRCNLRLVAKTALQVLRRARHLDIDDLVQEGRIGLFKAIEKYDLSLSVRLSTYATWWIRQSIERALADKDRLIRLPVHAEEDLRRINQAIYRWTAINGHEPTNEDLVKELHLSLEKVHTLRSMGRTCVSLDLPVGENRESSLASILPDYSSFEPEIFAEQRSLRHLLAEFLAQLPERERIVLELRFGWHDDVELTLEAVGQRFGVTRERIRQIEVKALKKLRNWRFLHQLEDYRA